MANNGQNTPNDLEVNNYEILQNLGKESKNLMITKVRPKINNEIYCMRKIKIENDIKDNDIEELRQKLLSIDNPHIIKYHDIFKHEEYICIIMEYIDTDLKNFIETYSVTKQKIPEETIFFLMLQCLSAVKCLHSDDYYKKGIRLSNILMPNERSIKIGIIKDKLPKDWKKKDDIGILYRYFVLLMFPMTFRPGQGILAYLPDPINNDYDKKLREIIYDMDSNNNNKIKDIFKRTNEYYIDKYLLKEKSKNTSIKTVFECISEFKKFNEGLNKEITNKTKTPESVSLIRKLYQDISQMKHEYYPSIEEFRRLIALEYPSFDNNNELNPYIITSFLLKKMENEKIMDGNEEKSISDYFSLVKQVVKRSNKCEDVHTSFEKDKIVTFYFHKDLKTFDLVKDGFEKSTKKEHSNEKLFCEKCLAYHEYTEEISYHNFNNYLIIYFNRGKNDEMTNKVNFEKEIKLTKIINSSDKIKFILKGGINIDKENKKYENINFKDSNQSKNIIIILFYEFSEKDNNN